MLLDCTVPVPALGPKAAQALLTESPETDEDETGMSRSLLSLLLNSLSLEDFSHILMLFEHSNSQLVHAKVVDLLEAECECECQCQ